MGPVQTLKPDTKGRVCLGSLAAGISSYHLTYDQISGKITLEPYTEVPLQEAWLFRNKAALQKVRRGMKQSEEGNLEDAGNFSQYIDKESVLRKMYKIKKTAEAAENLRKLEENKKKSPFL